MRPCSQWLNVTIRSPPWLKSWSNNTRNRRMLSLNPRSVLKAACQSERNTLCVSSQGVLETEFCRSVVIDQNAPALGWIVDSLTYDVRLVLYFWILFFVLLKFVFSVLSVIILLNFVFRGSVSLVKRLTRDQRPVLPPRPLCIIPLRSQRVSYDLYVNS